MQPEIETKNAVFSGFLESPEIHDESCIDPDSCEEYINKELSVELHPILRHKSLTLDFCQGHTMNGCCAKFPSNLNVNVGLSFNLTVDSIKNVFLQSSYF